MVIGTQPAAFDGIEHEPNDTPARANPLPLGRAVRGQLGARLGRDAGDRDVYAVDVPGPRDAVVSLHLEALPNLAACVEIAAARGGAPTVGRFCGAPGVDVDVPRLALAPGRHFIAIEQDVSAGAPLQENVSDFYTLTVDRKP
ncbi:MAG TPA: hypothetical protein VHB21_10335, partial [Minicystis sp.]|nr:hypothetical protein [Minicystis sp.]